MPPWISNTFLTVRVLQFESRESVIPGEKEVTHVSSELDGIPQYTAEEVEQHLQNKSLKVIDVRTPEEYAQGHIPGVPLLTMQTISEWESSLDIDTPYAFMCRSGARSQAVATYLKSKGFDVANCQGGMLSWRGDIECS